MRDDSSFIELKARQRAQALLDEGSYRELLDPFEGIISPWLGPQGIVPQADDGMVVAKGTINGKPAVVSPEGENRLHSIRAIMAATLGDLFIPDYLFE